MLPRLIQSPAYWTGSFKITRPDVEFLFSQFLEQERPLSNRDLALRLIRHRIGQEEEKLKKQIERGTLFQPREKYKVGQMLVFPALDYALGKVLHKRPGQNAEDGEFTVIEVEFEDKQRREFASMLERPHVLNIDEAGGQSVPQDDSVDAETIFERYGDAIIEEIEARLVDQDDALFFNGKWFLKSLLLGVNVGHLNLAEAILDINEGRPLPVEDILKELDLSAGSSKELAEISLNVAMSADERFEDVGPDGQIRWFLRRLEPADALTIPPRLAYQPLDYDRSSLTGELLEFERELDDELSNLAPSGEQPREALLSLIYPHRRVGTLPLTSRIERLFPLAPDGRHVRIIFVDGEDGTEFPGWVVGQHKYVAGLNDFYRRHRLPIGAAITVKATDDPLRIKLDFESYRPRTEYIRLAVPQNGRLTFANFKRSIGAGYDELLILGAEDIEGVDSIWTATRDRRRGLVDIMRDLMPELAKLNPQNAVHVKTLYGAVNILRRCPPGPIFAALTTRSDFEHVAGPYWRLSS
ncbi:MAG TPA: hypothetical protein VKQ72_22010 [Aggregatilineales bacterium]|nr:hypothetical protein [Aggregatilineales bacterium]